MWRHLDKLKNTEIKTELDIEQILNEREYGSDVYKVWKKALQWYSFGEQDRREGSKNQEIGEILKAGVVTWSEDGFRT